MFDRFLLPFLALCLTPPAVAQSSDDALLDQLFETSHIERHYEIIRDYAIGDWLATEANLFPGQGGADWLAAADAANGLDQIARDFRDGFQAVDVPPDLMQLAIDGYGTEFGQMLLTRGFDMDALMGQTPDLPALFAAAEAAGDPRVSAADGFIARMGTVETYLAFDLAGTRAYYQGLADAGGVSGGAEGIEPLMADYEEALMTQVAPQVLPTYREFFFLFAYDFDADQLQAWETFSATDWSMAYERAFQSGYRQAYAASLYRQGMAAVEYVGEGGQ